MRIKKVESTTEKLTGRSGLLLFVKYLKNVNIYNLLIKNFGDIKKSKKGLPVESAFKQIFCWLFDKTSRHLSYFDMLKDDPGYAAIIEIEPEEMATSHSIKRFCKSFTIFKVWTFRKILQTLFLWRLNIEKPDVIEIDIDTMVMNNDEAQKRHGVSPTYKKKKGFQPLQITWKKFIIDAVFRGGNRHSNYSDTTAKSIKHLVNLIRKHYCKDAVILLTCDSGFFDDKNFKEFEKLNIFYVSGARFTAKAKETISSFDTDHLKKVKNKDQEWLLEEFGFKYDNWKKFRRFIYCQPLYEDGQMLFDFERAETLLTTNIRQDKVTDAMPEKIRSLLDPKKVVLHYHSRGANELIHRSFKDFGFEQLPFKRFAPNAVIYYMMLISFFLFETFKADTLSPVIPVESYATTVRRRFVDIAGKIVNHSGEITLKISKVIFDSLRFDEIWLRCIKPPYKILC